jgi:hypothetical protein
MNSIILTAQINLTTHIKFECNNLTFIHCYFLPLAFCLISFPSLLKITLSLVVSTTLKYDSCSIQMFKVLEGRAYRLQHPWVGIVNRSQADINKNVDMIAARRKEREYFETSPEYGHLSSKMGSEYLAKLLSKVLFIHVALNVIFFNIWLMLQIY